MQLSGLSSFTRIMYFSLEKLFTIMYSSRNAYHSRGIETKALNTYQQGITKDLVEFMKWNILKCIFQVSCHSLNLCCILHSVGTVATYTAGCVEEFKLIEGAEVFRTWLRIDGLSL
jgi:hypothetical protein